MNGTLIGTGYRADVGETATIYDVPIFAATPPGAKHPDDRALDESWMTSVLERHQRRFAEGYRAPLHIDHHRSGRDTPFAGTFQVTRIGTIDIDGDTLPALFADFYDIPPEVYDEIRRNQLPYRSVEIKPDPDTGQLREEISSIALLNDVPPFHKMPLLQISEEHAREFDHGEEPWFAVGSAGTSTALVFDFHDFPQPSTEEPMATPKTKAPKKKASKKAPAKKPAAQPDTEFADGDDGGGDDKDDAELSDGAGAIQKVIDDFVKGLPKMVEDMLKSMMPAAPEASSEEEPVPAEFSESSNSETPTDGDDNSAKLRAEMAVLKDRLDARDKQDEIARFCDDTCAELDAEGYQITANFSENLAEELERSSDRARTVEIFKSTMRENGRMKPAATLAEFEDGPGSAFDDLPEDVAKFADENPSERGEVIRLFREFEGFPDHVKAGMPNTTAAKYVARHLKRKEA